jgi:uncharacterized protein (DUF362 family)
VVYYLDKVVLLRCRGNFDETFRAGIDLLGGYEPRSPFVVKPNLCTGDDHTGCANVKLEVVESLVSYVLEQDPRADIRIMESDRMSKYADKAFERYGYRAYAERLADEGASVELINLSKSPLTRFNFNGDYFKHPELPEVLSSTRDIASIALAKTHSLTMVTGALKNMFGLLPRKDQAFYHPSIHEVILDLNRMFRSSLCLIDARMGLEGVISGTPKEVGCLILGTNPVSVDSTMARVMGFEPKRIRHIVEASKYGLGSMDPEVLGDEVEPLTVRFREPSGLKKSAVL